MKRTLLTAALALFTLSAPLSVTAQPHHTFTTQADHFTLDGKPFKVLSGELHYARIPREYWHARLKMAKAMGLNTIATYVFWNVHEPTPGHYDFTGNNDLAAFIKAAQEEGLYVILRAGPYSCAEWEFGGLPAWLLNPTTQKVSALKGRGFSRAANSSNLNGALAPEGISPQPTPPQQQLFPLRSSDPAFITPTERWIHRLAQEVTPLQIGRGGPILMTQVENEYGNFGADHAYMAHLKQIFLEAGFTDSLLYSADNWRNIPNGSIPDLFAAVNFGIGNHQGGMDALARVRPDAPLFVSEYWPGWFDSWGHPHETRPIPPQLEDLDYILRRGAGINIYMFHGGTSFGFMSGAGSDKNGYRPTVTSYDYDAPLDESGRPTPKFYAYRKVLATYGTCGNESCLRPIPATPPIITIPQITLTESTPLWQNLPAPTPSQSPQPMEHFGQSYGYILYRTQLPAAVTGNLVLTDLHDYAQIYIDGKLTGTLDRRHHFENTLPLTTTGPARLDILVANDGRINSTKLMRGESKGITQSVTLAGTPVTNWQIYSLPMITLPHLYAGPRSLYPPGDFTEDARERVGKKVPFTPFSRDTPTFYRAHFTLAQTGDTFLDIRNLGKGALWVNGHPIGRFWNIGPQQTLYVPAPWLRKGTNEIVIFDLKPNPGEYVTGLDHPILDGPVPDRTRSSQQ